MKNKCQWSGKCSSQNKHSQSTYAPRQSFRTLFFHFLKNFILYILILSCSFPNSSQVLPHFPTPNFIFFLSFKKQKQTKNNHKKKDKHGVWFIFSQLLLSLEPIPECGWYAQWHSTEESWFSLSQSLWNGHSFLAGGGILCYLPSCGVRFLSGLSSCRFGVCYHSLHEFIWVCRVAWGKYYFIGVSHRPQFLQFWLPLFHIDSLALSGEM